MTKIFNNSIEKIKEEKKKGWTVLLVFTIALIICLSFYFVFLTRENKAILMPIILLIFLVYCAISSYFLFFKLGSLKSYLAEIEQSNTKLNTIEAALIKKENKIFFKNGLLFRKITISFNNQTITLEVLESSSNDLIINSSYIFSYKGAVLYGYEKIS